MKNFKYISRIELNSNLSYTKNSYNYNYIHDNYNYIYNNYDYIYIHIYNVTANNIRNFT